MGQGPKGYRPVDEPPHVRLPFAAAPVPPPPCPHGVAGEHLTRRLSRLKGGKVDYDSCTCPLSPVTSPNQPRDGWKIEANFDGGGWFTIVEGPRNWRSQPWECFTCGHRNQATIARPSSVGVPLLWCDFCEYYEGGNRSEKLFVWNPATSHWDIGPDHPDGGIYKTKGPPRRIWDDDRPGSGGVTT